MKKFIREKRTNVPTPDINLDFGAAAAKVPQLFEPGDYRLRIDSALVTQNTRKNVFVALDLVMTADGCRVGIRPLWVDGPNAAGSQFAENNKNLVAQLLNLAGLPTSGDVGSLIPKLAALEFDSARPRYGHRSHLQRICRNIFG